MRIIHLVGLTFFLPVFLFSQTTHRNPPPDHVPGRLIVNHAGSTNDPMAKRAFALHGGRVRATFDKLGATILDVPVGSEESIRQSLKANPLFKDVELDHYASEGNTPNDPNFSTQWYLTKIQATSAWDYTTGSGTPIAVVDSGVDGSHPDLAARLLPGWNFVAGNGNTSDMTGHGTAVAGTLGAISNNGMGVAGVTWQNPILPLVVTDSTGYATYSNIAAAIQYAADHGARVINVSLGGSSPSSVLQNAVNYAWNAGAIVVAAAMNNGSSTPQYPAACTNAVAVSATDENDNLAGFSDFGSWITLSAPGNDIETTVNGGSYGEWAGTSFAAPVVSGVAALALGANSSLSAQALVTLLEQNADDLGSAGYDSYFGWGRVNAYRTVMAARGQSAPTYAPSAPAAPSSSSTYFIHAGGGALTDASGQSWSADLGYSGGSTWSVPNYIYNAATPSLYQTCRWGNFAYNLAVPNGTYTVTLKFAEMSVYGPGQRLFDVTLNGSQVLTNFDIYSQAGGTFVAVDKSFPVTVSNGAIYIQFSSVGVNMPMVNAVEVTPGSQTGSSASLMVNAGGGSVTDASGRTWSADSYYSGGSTYGVSNSISNTNSPALYQSCRYGSFTYSLPVSNGSYTVTLKFAELSVYGPGQRLFDVTINGSQVLTNFDIYGQAGGAFIALDKSFPVNVANGSIYIQFTFVGVNMPLVNGIQVTPGAQSASVPAFLIHAGGGNYTDSAGQTWSADSYYSGGSTWSVTNNIANTSSPGLYQTCRYGNFTYTFPVTSGSYNVTLKFAEVSATGPGQRVFNVTLNGSQVLTNFDIVARAGGEFVALDQTFPVTVSGGQITIQFTSGAANLPMVNAIQIASM